MIFEHRDVMLAFEPATGEFGVYEPGTELPDDTNPRPVSKDTNETGFMKQIILEVSQKCDLRCTYCPHTHGGQPGIREHQDFQMPPEVAELGMQILEKHGNDESLTCFYGGEPLMNLPLIKEVVERRPERGYVIDTNGMKVDDALIEWAIQYNIEWQVSIDGPTRMTDKYRGVGVTRRALNAIKLIKDAGQNIRMAVTMAPPYDVDAVADFLEQPLLADLSFKPNIAKLIGAPIAYERFPITEMRERFFAACLEGKREQLPRLHRKFFEEDLMSFRESQLNKRGVYGEWVVGGCCDPAVHRVFVSAKGGLFPCERVTPEFEIGRVETGIDYNKIRAHHETFYQERSQKGCETCWALRLCGGCWVGEIDCDNERARNVHVMKLYYDLYANGVAEWLDAGCVVE